MAACAALTAERDRVRLKNSQTAGQTPRAATASSRLHETRAASPFLEHSERWEDPFLPAHFAPFGIQNILGNLYVTYAKQDDDREDDVKGAGFGFVDVFNADGRLLRRFASRGPLKAPWGLA